MLSRHAGSDWLGRFSLASSLPPLKGPCAVFSCIFVFVFFSSSAQRNSAHSHRQLRFGKQTSFSSFEVEPITSLRAELFIVNELLRLMYVNDRWSDRLETCDLSARGRSCRFDRQMYRYVRLCRHEHAECRCAAVNAGTFQAWTGACETRGPVLRVRVTAMLLTVAERLGMFECGSCFRSW